MPDIRSIQLTTREKAILDFIHNHRLVTSSQVARVFWLGKAKSQDLANRSLRKLFDLHLIDRFFPQVEKGSSLQHVTLSRLGSKVLGVRYRHFDRLPANHKHTTLVTDFRIMAREFGWSWGITEYNLGVVRADIFYPERKTAVEIDLGTEGVKALKAKAVRYRRADIQEIVMITNGSKERLSLFLSELPFPKKAGTQVDNIQALLKRI